MASLVWRLEHGTLLLDQRSVVLVDEAGRAADAELLELLVAVEEAGAKAVVVGDHRQLGAVGPRRAVVVLDENVRQRDRAERAVLEEPRAGDVAGPWPSTPTTDA